MGKLTAQLEKSLRILYPSGGFVDVSVWKYYPE